MWTIHQFPLCPFSRKVRILLREKGVPFALQRLDPWKAADDFFDMNHAGRVPVVEETEKGIVLSDSTAICEYFEETVDKAPMINGSALNRAEIRRLVALFEENLFGARVARQFCESLYQQSSKSPSAQFGADADQQQFFFARRAARQYKAACFRLAIADQPRFCIDEDRVGMRQGKRIGDLLAGPGFPPVRIESGFHYRHHLIERARHPGSFASGGRP